jgi:hypothetical protein
MDFVFLTPDSLPSLVPSAFGLHRRFPRPVVRDLPRDINQVPKGPTLRLVSGGSNHPNAESGRHVSVERERFRGPALVRRESHASQG